jgi:precorrin-2/cobalt-factor-2 C20-methyltransferase
MTLGTLYGIGIGPGDPDLITVKGVQLLSRCRHVVVPKASESADSVALRIVKKHLNPLTEIHEVVFPMITKRDELMARWRASAAYVESILSRGEDACFPTLGDTFLYSTYIYLVRALRDTLPEACIVTIPGVTAFSAVAAVTEFAIGEGKQSVTIVPTADDLTSVSDALRRNGTVVIMKIGKRLEAVLDLLEERQAIETAVFASHIGMPDEHVETDLRKLRGRGEQIGYLSIILANMGTECLE